MDHRWRRAAVAAVAVGAVAAQGCASQTPAPMWSSQPPTTASSGADQVLTETAQTVATRLELDPVGALPSVTPVAQQGPGGATYVATEGTRPGTSTEDAVAVAAEVLEGRGWQVEQLGRDERGGPYQLVAARGDQHVKVVSRHGDEEALTYPPLDGAVYVTVLVSSADDPPRWIVDALGY